MTTYISFQPGKTGNKAMFPHDFIPLTFGSECGEVPHRPYESACSPHIPSKYLRNRTDSHTMSALSILYIIIRSLMEKANGVA